MAANEVIHPPLTRPIPAGAIVETVDDGRRGTVIEHHHARHRSSSAFNMSEGRQVWILVSFDGEKMRSLFAPHKIRVVTHGS